MIERSIIDSGKSVIDSNVILPIQSDNRFRDNIDISNAILNPQLLKEKTEAKSPEIPIWESSRSELYASTSGLKRFVIWKYDPGGEGVIKFNPFDAFDPLPHHYYKSRKEYEESQKIYASGKTPDKLIDLNIFNWDF